VADDQKPKKKAPLLKKWRFEEDKKGHGGEAKYWWSDGTKSEERVSSHVDAVARLKDIQDGGGLKPPTL
jgi:hypothetical protein